MPRVLQARPVKVMSPSVHLITVDIIDWTDRRHEPTVGRPRPARCNASRACSLSASGVEAFLQRLAEAAAPAADQVEIVDAVRAGRRSRR